jgi:RNA polymerase sigma-70 factor (ECF subfamily)
MNQMDARARILAFFGTHTDEASFADIYRQELPRVFNYFRFRIGDDTNAEDLTSETFEKAWRSRAQYRHDRAAFTTWLFTIAQRVLVDYLRKNKTVIPLEALHELPADETTEDAILKQADFTRLNVLLAQLADRDRELVSLRYGAGLTNRTIARLTGLSESNVGVLLHRAVQKLRKDWREEEEKTA